MQESDISRSRKTAEFKLDPFETHCEATKPFPPSTPSPQPDHR
ncbi:hypothetical protein RRSWK_03206 [Rhodopirellula sp. SWK7]|nr:hypothetical protein RRSWK_03206 [Rhodopirellula sp. SWK7]